MKLILATNNENKVREIRQMLTGTGISVLSQSEAGYDIEVEETGKTFAENAALKAHALHCAAQNDGNACYTLADDSGLSVDALQGEPGVHSHRWAGENATDAERCEKLLRVMKDIPADARGAHFTCVMCLISPDGEEHYFEGRVNGEIRNSAQGENGFGYDPVFQYKGKSFASLSAEEKNQVSHRALALQKLLKYLLHETERSV